MREAPHDIYMKTIDRMEPAISAVDAAAYYASAAISLRRIADTLRLILWAVILAVPVLALTIGGHH